MVAFSILIPVSPSSPVASRQPPCWKLTNPCVQLSWPWNTAPRAGLPGGLLLEFLIVSLLFSTPWWVDKGSSPASRGARGDSGERMSQGTGVCWGQRDGRLKPAGTGPGVLGHFPGGAWTPGRLEVVLQENRPY